MKQQPVAARKTAANGTRPRSPVATVGKVLPIKAAKTAKAASTVKPSHHGFAVRAVDVGNWDQRLGFLMHDVSRLRRSVFDEFMRPLGVTRSQWWVLAYLSRHDGMNQSDLANVLDLGKAALGGLIDRLEASGFIERRADDSDRRVKRIFLSASGTHMIKEMNVRSHEMSERILAGLPASDRQRLAELLTLVKGNLLAIRGENQQAN